MKKFLLLIGVLMLSGCAAFTEGFMEGWNRPPDGREKSGASVQDFQRARYQCIQSASSRVVSGSATANTPYSPGYQSNVNSQIMPSCQMYSACMEANGFQLVSNGRFQSPVDCRNP